MLPLSGLLIAFFVGWRMRREVLRDELFVESEYFFTLWRFCLRYIAVPAMVLVLVFSAYTRFFHY